jgi:lipopolysaccharide transport system permease protein
MEVKVIDASRSNALPPLGDVWRRRELAVLFTRRHIASRYRQMALGGLWAVLEPLAQLILMSVVFGFLLRVQTNGYPYAVYVFAALIPWQHFARTTMAVAGSLQENMTLISKVYFPRLILPVAAVMRELFDTAVQIVILLVVAAWFGFYPSLRLLVAAPFVLIAVSLAGAGLGLCAAGIIVRYRDVRPALSIALQGGMYLSPVLYAASIVPPALTFWYQLNPMYWAIEAFRWMLLGQSMSISSALPVALLICVILFGAGLVIFTLNERKTVDVL